MGPDVTLENICISSENFMALEIEGAKIIVPLVSNFGNINERVCTLSETGWAIWQQLDGKQNLGQVAEALSEKFSSPADEISKDVLGFISEMIRCGACILLNGNNLKHLKDGNDTGKNTTSKNDNVEPVFAQLPTESSSLYITKGGELKLSNLGQLNLLRCMKDRGVSLRTMVRGFSMHPFIRDQDVLTIEPLNDRLPGVGDVVAFSHPEYGSLFIHRIVKKTNSGWLLKGDNCLESDGVVPRDNIIGHITHIERNAKEVRFCLGMERNLIAFLNRGKGLFLLKQIWHLPRLACGFFYNKLLRRIDDR